VPSALVDAGPVALHFIRAIDKCSSYLSMIIGATSGAYLSIALGLPAQGVVGPFAF
jgi:uncharacterized membrane protein YoaK (UPF0700 family)